jgi:hypothetical protein
MVSYPPSCGYPNSLVPPLKGLALIIVRANSPKEMCYGVSANASIQIASKNDFVRSSRHLIACVKDIVSHLSVFLIDVNAKGKRILSSFILLRNGIIERPNIISLIRLIYL